MMKRGDVLASGVEQSSKLLARYLEGFDDGNRVRQMPGLPNHAAWTMGHLAYVMHRAAERIDGMQVPEDDFIDGAESGDAMRFGVESVALGSTVTSDSKRYPSWARCREIFEASVQRLSIALREADDAALDATKDWGKAKTTAHDLASRMVFHTGAHGGQLIDLRRALNMPRVVG
jgi:hypothetical protein